MSTSSPPRIRLPHASAGPMWCPPAARPAPEWREIETLLTAPSFDADESAKARGGIGSIAFVVAALAIGGGLLAATLIGNRNDCGAACHVVTAIAGPTGKPAAKTAGLAPSSDARMVEGRSVAEPGASDGPDGTKADATAPEAPTPIPHRHHHRHHHHDIEPY